MNRFFAVALLCVALPAAQAAPLLESGSLELPYVQDKERRSAAQGGSPLKSAEFDEWERFENPPAAGGRLTLGISTELPRTGRQSLYVEFDKLTTRGHEATLASRMLPILPGKPYHVAAWGRLAKKQPLTIDQRLAYLRLEVEWFEADAETPAGDPVYKLQPMPGSRNRPPLFTAGRWTEYFADVVAPEDAAYIRIRWIWGSPQEDGETSGTIYFDDFTIDGEPGPRPPTAFEELEAEQAAAEAAAPSPSAPAPKE